MKNNSPTKSKVQAVAQASAQIAVSMYFGATLGVAGTGVLQLLI
jgi:hypothetical protein